MIRRRIPVGLDGYVPLRAVVSRYHEAGDRRDSRSTDERVLVQRLTPKDIEGWWGDPGSCDIDGIDTRDSPLYHVPASIRGRKRAALSRIAVISDSAEADRIRLVLAKHFTADELLLMADQPSLIVSTVDHLDGCTGIYLRRQGGIPVPEIVLEHGTTADGIVHEVVHALRDRDGRTSFPMTDGRLDPSYGIMSGKRKRSIQQEEERRTVAETVARTETDPVESGYYGHIRGVDPRAAYLHDQDVVSGSRALKGKAAIRAAERNYDRTSISRAVISGNLKRRRRRDAHPPQETGARRGGSYRDFLGRQGLQSPSRSCPRVLQQELQDVLDRLL